MRIVDLPSGWTTKEHCGSKSPIGARSADKVDIKTPPLLRPARRGLVGAGGVPGASRLRNTSEARRPAIARAPYPAQPVSSRRLRVGQCACVRPVLVGHFSRSALLPVGASNPQPSKFGSKTENPSPSRSTKPWTTLTRTVTWTGAQL